MLHHSLRPAFLLAGVLMAGFLLLGCGEDAESESPPVTVHRNVDARFMGTASEGRDAVLHHESIPGVMEAMVMPIPLADTAEIAPFAPGDTLRFDLAVGAASLEARNLRALPDTARLELEE